VTPHRAPQATAKSHLFNDDDHGAAGLLGVAGDLRVALGFALFTVDYQQRHIAALKPRRP